MSQAHEGKIKRLGTKMEHVGHTLTTNEKGEQSDLSGQLPKLLVGHPRHGGASHEESEKMIKSERDSSPALNKALPVNADALAAPTSGAERE